MTALDTTSFIPPTCSTAISAWDPKLHSVPLGNSLAMGAELLMEVYHIGLNYLRQNASEIGLGLASAKAYDVLSDRGVKLLFHGSKQSEKLIEQIHGKLKKDKPSSTAVSTYVIPQTTNLPKYLHGMRVANASFKDKRLIGGTIHELNKALKLGKKLSKLNSAAESADPKSEIKEMQLEFEKVLNSASWKIAKIGFGVASAVSFDKGTAKIAKELGTFVFWGKGEPLKNFRAFKEALAKSGAIAALKEGDLATAMEKIDDKTLKAANKAGVDAMTYTSAGLTAASFSGFPCLDPLATASGNLLFSWKLFNLLWDPKVAETPNEERSWFVRLFTDHYHSPRNQRANRLLSRNLNPYR